MGRLLNPGLGELADRFTILLLKILHAGRRPVAHFHAEMAQVQMQMERVAAQHTDSNGPGLSMQAIETAIQELRAKNTELWNLEDTMAGYVRAKPWWDGTVPYQVAETGVAIWKANQERNQIIQEINRLAGTDYGPEKLP